MKKKFKKMRVPVLCVLLAFVFSLNSFVFALSPSQYLVRWWMPKGGNWSYTGADPNVTGNWSSTDWRSHPFVQRMDFYSPDAVQAEANMLGYQLGISQQQSYIQTGISLALNYGIDVAKTKLTAQLGTSIASKVIPFLNAFSWGYTAYTVLEAMAKGQELARFTDAAQKHKGLIYVDINNTAVWYYWDGSSQYGTYPYANVGPNNWELGTQKSY